MINEYFQNVTEITCNPNFIDELGSNCQRYLDQKYCTIRGEEGDGWSLTTYPIQSYLNKDGESPLVCPHCGCKLGNNFLSFEKITKFQAYL